MTMSTATSFIPSPLNYKDFLSTTSATPSVTATEFWTRIWGRSFDEMISKVTYDSDTGSFQYRSFRVPPLDSSRSQEDFVIFDKYEAVWNDILKLRSLGPSYRPVTPSDDIKDDIDDVDMDGAENWTTNDLALKADGSKVRLPTIVAVVGHPGIGKSVWLLYVLSRLLCASQPVLIPATSEYDIFFCASGAYQISTNYLAPAICDFLGPQCWALADSDDVNPMVPIRYRRTKVSLIQVSAPLKNQLRWLEKMNGTKRYFVSPPSMQEYLAACHIQRVPLEQSLCRSFYADFGPSIRLALLCCRSREAYNLNARENVALIKYMDYERFSEMVRCCGALEFDEMSARVLVTRSDRSRARHRLEYVSPFVERLIRDRLQTAWANNCGDFISMCSSDMCRSLAVSALELGFHSKLAQGGRYRLAALVDAGSSKCWNIKEDNVKWESEYGYYASTHLLAIGRRHDQDEVSAALHPSDSAPHIIPASLPRKSFSRTNPPLPTSLTTYWQPTKQMAFDSLIFDAQSNTVFLFRISRFEMDDTKAPTLLFVREHFPHASIHYILVSHDVYAYTLLGAATSQLLASKWHSWMNLDARPDDAASELQEMLLY